MVKYIISWVLRHIPRPFLQRVSGLFLKILALFYQGDQVECPICKHQYRKFLPYGRKARPNALCPNCLALERHRLMWLYLKEKTDFFQQPQRVLHIAPEACFIDRFDSMDNLDYITADLESPLAKVKMDIHQMPFPDNSFDVAFCNHVMEHVADDIKALSELNRVLKPGGWAIIQVPFFHPIPEVTEEDPTVLDPKEREQKYGQDDHVRLYGKDYKQRLERGGLAAVEEQFVDGIPEDRIRKFALPKGETIYIGRKRQQ